MATIRNVFHELGNWHNKISVIAGVTRTFLTEADWASLKSSELKEMTSKIVKALNEIEQNAIGADKIGTQLKEFIYKLVNPDTEVNPKNKKGEK